MKLRTIAAAAVAATGMAAAPAMAQQVEGDASSTLTQWGRQLAEPGTFWLDGNEDVEIVRYRQPRDVSLCLPAPRGVGAAEQGYSLRITWDEEFSTVLRPGNCFFFDAARVKISPATDLPPGVTLTGQVQTESALRDQ